MLHAVTQDDDPVVEADPLRSELLRRKGTRLWQQYATDVRLNVSMLRAYLRGDSDAGIETLCVLAAWDPTLEGLILDKMRERGERYRARFRSREQPVAA